MPLRAWLRAPVRRGDIIVSVLVPTVAVPHRAMHCKIGLRAAFTPSVIGAAGVVVLDSAGRVETARFAVGGGITAPQCLDAATENIVGRTLDSVDWHALRDRIAAEIEAPSDPVRSGYYRKVAAANALVAGLGGEKAIEQVCGVVTPEPRPAPRAARAPSLVEVSREVVGDRWRIRPDIEDKVAGRLAYLTDHRRAGMLVGRILRAGIPHARIVSVDTSAAEALPGVTAVVTAEDIRGQNGYGIVIQDQPALCADKVRYAGDVVAAVAAVDEETAARALALIRVAYEPLPIVDDMERALAPGAPAVHASGNLQREMHFSRGDVEAAWSRCAHIVESSYVTPRQMHAFMETEGGYVVPEAGRHAERVRRRPARRPRSVAALAHSWHSRAPHPRGDEPDRRRLRRQGRVDGAAGAGAAGLKSGRPVRLHLIAPSWSRRTNAQSDAHPHANRLRCLRAPDRSGARSPGRLRRICVAQPERA